MIARGLKEIDHFRERLMNLLVHVNEFFVEMFVVEQPRQLKFLQIIFFLKENRRDFSTRKRREKLDARVTKRVEKRFVPLERTNNIRREDTK